MAVRIELLLNGIFGVITSITIFVMICLIYYSGTGTHGSVVHSETSEWEHGAILDVTTTNTTCPSGYEVVSSRFFGTKTICMGAFTWTYGACSKKSRG